VILKKVVCDSVKSRIYTMRALCLFALPNPFLSLKTKTNMTTNTKRIIAVVVALLVAFAVIGGFEKLGPVLFKTPVIDSRDPKTISDMMASMPMAAFIWLLLSYAIASLLGGVIATYISGREKIQPALIVGAFLMVGGIMNFIIIPYHPIWFMVVNMLEYIPFALIGYAVVKKKKEEPTIMPDGVGENN
jgi:hypothetical protein